ncbi:DNA mismatch repair endonuclease MutL [Desulfovibrio sp. OttesenSCG-928-G15]|nr:DNA mismatch repair endonuclease MutL [Desulfovibrio sp. OttesenSCG-928-G15]
MNTGIFVQHKPIRLLPEALRNQIAAGEVVERPASVLKELVENSLDAGASDVCVTLEDGGQTLLAVRDNGTGIAPQDLELAVTRHATSKVASFSDLIHVASYGFRGEALPSIGSVADLRVESAFAPLRGKAGAEEADAAAGVKTKGATDMTASAAGGASDATYDRQAAFIRVRHGEVADRGISSLHQGTLVEVRDLFANVPARLKFLKTPSTELKRCQESLLRLALARQDVGFRLVAVGGGKEREIFRLEAGVGLGQRLAALWPPQVVDNLVALDEERKGVRVSGLISLPQSVQARGDRIFFYVNHRPVTNRLLLQAFREAYKGRLTSREYPQAVLFIEIDPQEIDVNVHPAKTEVRFRDERAMFSALLGAVQSALSRQAGAVLGFAPNDAGCGFGEAARAAHGPNLLPLPPLYQKQQRPGGDADGDMGFPSGAGESEGLSTPGAPDGFSERRPRPEGFWGTLDRPRIVDFPEYRNAVDDVTGGAYANGPDHGATGDAKNGPSAGADGKATGLFASSRVFPVHGAAKASEAQAAFGSYAGPGPAGPGVSDAPAVPDAPAVSMQYEDGTASVCSGGYPVRVGPLLCLGQVADTYLVIVRDDTLLLVDQHAAHERVLYHAMEQDAGRAQSQLLALPTQIPLHPSERSRLEERYPDLQKLGFQLTVEENRVTVSGVPPLLGRSDGLALLRDIVSEKIDGLGSILNSMACKSAIKAGQKLTADEAAGLLRQWMNTPSCAFCPHGRPSVLSFAPADLEKMFKRTIG